MTIWSEATKVKTLSVDFKGFKRSIKCQTIQLTTTEYLFNVSEGRMELQTGKTKGVRRPDGSKENDVKKAETQHVILTFLCCNAEYRNVMLLPFTSCNTHSSLPPSAAPQTAM